MLSPRQARAILRTCDAEENFFALSSATVEHLLTYADVHRYRAPKNANGVAATEGSQQPQKGLAATLQPSYRGQAQYAVLREVPVVVETRAGS